MYLAGAISGGAGVLVTYLPTWQAAALGIAALIVMLAAIAWLERAPYERQAEGDETTVA